MRGKAIWKFQVPYFPAAFPGEEQEIRGPIPLIPVHVDMQGSELMIWCEVNPKDQFTTSREVAVVGTGQPIPTPPMRHIGTVKDGQFVWHVYVSMVKGERDEKQ